MTTAIGQKPRIEVEATSIPDGEYAGVWGGYLARFRVDGVIHMVDTNIGIRTPNAPCIVTVEGGKVFVRNVATTAGIDKGGQNPPMPSTNRPAPPRGSGAKNNT